MDKHQPKVSLGMPVYNGEAFLVEVLDSLLSQTFTDFELIISDNESNDATQDICTDYAAQDKRIRYHRNQTNIGAAKNYNRVFDMARGEYFKWAAADDLCGPDYLARCVDVLDAERDIVLAYPKTTIIDDKSQPLRKYEDGLNMVSGSPGARFIQTYYNCRLCNAVFGLMRSNVLRQTRLIKDFIASDKALLAELSLLGQFRELPDYMFGRRFHAADTDSTNVESREYKASFVSLGQAKQLEWLNPTHKSSVTFIHWKLFGAYLISINRVPVKLSQKVFTTTFLFGTLFANAKYLRELGQAIKQLVGTNKTTSSVTPETDPKKTKLL